RGDAEPRRSAQALDFILAAPAGLGLEGAAVSSFFEIYARQWRAYFAETAIDIERLPPVEGFDWEAARARMRDLRAGVASARSVTALWLKWLGTLTADLRSLAARGRLISPSDGARTETHPRVEEAIASIVTSQTHMLCNRLGIAIVQEYRLVSAL